MPALEGGLPWRYNRVMPLAPVGGPFISPFRPFPRMISQPDSAPPGNSTTGVLLSGGIDSAILLAHLLVAGRRVQPFYIRGGLRWEAAEQQAVARLLGVYRCAALADLVTLEMPVADLYTDHWSLGSTNPQVEVPADTTPDEAVYLPGRNPLLLLKAALWCGMQGIERLALGTLRANPFADATPAFCDQFGKLITESIGARVVIEQPLAHLSKQEVLELGRTAPLAATFSCLAPVAGLHCGQCNKCGERRAALAAIGRVDPTTYAQQSQLLETPCLK